MAASGSRWGQGWRNSFVFALTVYNGELIAGGEFTTAGGVTCNSHRPLERQHSGSRWGRGWTTRSSP
jgi:hypothetical protein